MTDNRRMTVNLTLDEHGTKRRWHMSHAGLTYDEAAKAIATALDFWFGDFPQPHPDPERPMGAPDRPAVDIWAQRVMDGTDD